MSFLPEEDQEFLDDNGIKYELLTEKTVEGAERRGVLFSDFAFEGNLRTLSNVDLVVHVCHLLVLIPDSYATTKLDSFYTVPRLKRPDGTDPRNANGQVSAFGKDWQFWSRHLDDKDWRVGIDGLRTYLSYIRGELRSS